MQLGLLRLSESDEEDTEPNLPLARHSIDLLGMLQEKTTGNLTAEEQRLLENGLTELRYRYVQVSEQEGLKAGPSDDVRIDKTHNSPMIITPDGGKGSKTE